MATKSFDEMMVIDTPEAAANLNKAYRDAVKRGPMVFEGKALEMLRESEEYLKNNPNWLKDLAAKIREDMIKEGIDPDEAIKEVVWPDD
jgi:hypothetical protein